MQYADNFFLFEIKWMTELSRFNECSYRLQAESIRFISDCVYSICSLYSGINTSCFRLEIYRKSDQTLIKTRDGNETKEIQVDSEKYEMLKQEESNVTLFFCFCL